MFKLLLSTVKRKSPEIQKRAIEPPFPDSESLYVGPESEESVAQEAVNIIAVAISKICTFFIFKKF
jgi:hypothetical protein